MIMDAQFTSLQDVVVGRRAILASLHTETKHKPQALLPHRADGPSPQRGTIIPVMMFFSHRSTRSSS
jgi:hypothetical protein